MKKVAAFSLVFIFFCYQSFAQKIWDGGGGDGLWANATNWVGDVAPIAADEVVLDNSVLSGTYTVTLPNTAVTILALKITPSGTDSIKLVLPSTNTFSPGFQTTGSSYCIVLNNRAILKNSSGAASVPTITVGATTADSMKINNGGTYEHNNARSITTILDKISTAVGTEFGLVHYNMTLTGTATIAMQGRTFGSLEFSAGSAPSALTYSSTGTTNASPVVVRGNLKVNTIAAFTSTIIGGFSIAGNFITNGNFNYAPATSANPGTRSLYFNGTSSQNIQGIGNLTFGANFINAEVSTNSTVYLQRVINLNNAGNSFILNTSGSLFLGTDSIIGLGTFTQNTDSWLGIGAVNGINTVATGNLGNIQTATRTFSTSGKFEYNGTLAQQTGTALPSTLSQLKINNTNGLTFNTAAGSSYIQNILFLTLGKITTSSTNYLIAANTTTIQSPINNYGNTNEGYEQSFVNGPMLLHNNVTTAVTLPVGKDTLFAPIKLTKFNNNPVDYTVEYFKTAYSDLTTNLGQLSRVSAKEYWTIVSSNVSSSQDDDAYISLSWRPYSEVGDGIPAHDTEALDSLVVAHYTNPGAGNEWLIDGYVNHLNPLFTKTGTVNYGTITTTIYTGSFSPFTLGGRSAFNLLAVKFINLSAKKINNTIELNWTVKDEQQLKHYEVEKSIDGVHFYTIQKVNAANAINEISYNAIDTKPIKGYNFYRIKAVENNKRISHSTICKVWNNEDKKILVQPSIIQTTVQITLPIGTTQLYLMNTVGSILKEYKVEKSILEINVTLLAAGVYYFKAIGNYTGTTIAQFIKQ